MQHQSHPNSGKTLLDLPIELRSLIYQDVLDDIIRPPLHPWDELPKPKMYLSLLLVNREISEEVGDLFQKLYSDKLMLFFDDLVHIHWICQNMQSWPALRNTRFWSRAILEDVEEEGDAKHEGVMMLMDRQPGYKEEWDDYPGYFKTETTDWCSINGFIEWDPEADGFTRTTISHRQCPGMGIQCVPFKKLQFPVMDSGLRVTTYRWRVDGPLDDSDIEADDFWPVDSGAMVLEGRLDALSFQDVPVKVVRRRMECERRMEGEGRKTIVHSGCGCYGPWKDEDSF